MNLEMLDGPHTLRLAATACGSHHDPDCASLIEAAAEYRKLATAVEHSAGITMITDREGRIEYVNTSVLWVCVISRHSRASAVWIRTAPPKVFGRCRS